MKILTSEPIRQNWFPFPSEWCLIERPTSVILSFPVTCVSEVRGAVRFVLRFTESKASVVSLSLAVPQAELVECTVLIFLGSLRRKLGI